MIIATLLASAALQAAVPPPPEPPTLPPPARAMAPVAPLPPLPPLPPLARGGGPGVMSFDSDGHHVTIIKRRDGAQGPNAQNVLRYKDGDGRDVTVITDKPITQAEAERMERDARARIPEIKRRALESARLSHEDVQVIVRQAREQAQDAVRQADVARQSGEIARREGEKAREYAQVIVKRLHEGRDGVIVDGGPAMRPGEAAELSALRDEVHALRDELRSLKDQLRADPPR